MGKRYSSSDSKRSARNASSFRADELSPEATQQVENFVDVLAGLLNGQADQAGQPTADSEKDTPPPCPQKRVSWPSQGISQGQAKSSAPRPMNSDAGLVDSSVRPQSIDPVDLKTRDYRAKNQEPPAYSRLRNYEVGSYEADSHEVSSTRTVLDLNSASAAHSPVEHSTDESPHSFRDRQPDTAAESGQVRDRETPLPQSSSVGVVGSVEEDPTESVDAVLSPEVEPSTATIHATEIDASEIDASELVTTDAVLSPTPTESSALVLSSSQPQPPQSASDTNVKAESAAEALNHLRTLLTDLEEELYDPDKLVKLLLPAVTEAIRDRLKTRRSAIANVLRAEMAVPIQEQIAIERDSIIDALYPVIGSTVSAYFTETLDTINRRIGAADNDGIVPRFEDSQSSTANGKSHRGSASMTAVQALFLVHQPTRLLLAKALSSRELASTVETQTEMLTAARSFADAQMEQPNLNASAQAGKYRQGQILVEFSEPCYLAAVIQGDAPVSFLRQMRQVLHGIVAEHQDFIAAFEGNVDAVPETIAHTLRRLLNAHTGANKRRRPVLLAGLGVLLLGSAIASYWGVRTFRDRQVQNTNDEVQRTAALLNQGSGVAITAETREKEVIVEGEVLQLNDVGDILQSFEQVPGIETVIDRIEVQPSTISTRVYFYTGSTAISPRDIAGKIADIANLLNEYPEYSLKVMGYQNPAAEADMTDLGLQRALAVADVLADQGIARERLEALAAAGVPSGVNVEYQPWLSQAVLFEIVRPKQEN